MLAKLNKWLQHSEMSLHIVYSKIRALTKAFMEPIVLDSDKDITDEDNLHPLELSVQKFPGSDFQKHDRDCIEHSLQRDS